MAVTLSWSHLVYSWTGNDLCNRKIDKLNLRYRVSVNLTTRVFSQDFDDFHLNFDRSRKWI